MEGLSTRGRGGGGGGLGAMSWHIDMHQRILLWLQFVLVHECAIILCRSSLARQGGMYISCLW